LHPGAARRGNDQEGQTVLQGPLNAVRNFFAGCAPMLPPMKAKSKQTMTSR
jgi:hypothetical protein